MTYLKLVNKVLRKLREDEVSTVNENDYSKLVGDFVNDAISSVEAAWDWSCLRNTLTITTTASDNKYSLTDHNTRSEVMSIYNIANGQEVVRRTKEYILQKGYGTVVESTPRYYALNGIDANGDVEMLLYPTPDKSYSFDVNAVKRNTELVDNTDSTFLPSLPIVQYAFAYALRERGETGGQSASEQLVIARRDLSDAIALDSANQADELVFGEV